MNKLSNNFFNIAKCRFKIPSLTIKHFTIYFDKDEVLSVPGENKDSKMEEFKRKQKGKIK